MNQSSNPPTTTVCGHCGIEELTLLHHVRLRGNFRRLCTTCVLRLHPQCFCPTCFGVYDRTPPENAVVCYKCYSSSHSTCVSSSRAPSPCSSCLNPNSLVLNLSRVECNGSSNRVIDDCASRLILAAGKISAMSMSKAEVAASTEAERRAKEAAYTKKRAREALDHVVCLMEKEKSSKRVLIANNCVADGGVKGSKVDGSSEVLEALNAVELKEKGREGNGVAVMDVEVVDGKALGVGCVNENGSVKNGLVSVVGPEQSVEKICALEEDSVCNPTSVGGKH